MAVRRTMRAATRNFVEVDGLKTLVVRLARELDACNDAKLVPQLARQYRETMARISEIEGGIDEDDEIAAIILRNRKSGAD